MTPVTPEAEPRWKCQWCGVPLSPVDGVWTDRGTIYNSGDYCSEGRAVGSTGTSPHLPFEVRAASPDRPEPAWANCSKCPWSVTGAVSEMQAAQWLSEHHTASHSASPDRLAGGLDVERLERVIALLGHWPDTPTSSVKAMAAAIAAEYDRLSGLTEEKP